MSVSIREANAALAFAKRMNRLRTEAEGRAYHRWLDEQLGIYRDRP
jgi:hypothetical protein